MIRESHTAVIERHAWLIGVHHTEPYECAWASEAIFFLHTVAASDADITVSVEISADGRRWFPHGTAAVVEAGSAGAAVPIRHFGGWLRLRLDGPDERGFRYDLHLALKE